MQKGKKFLSDLKLYSDYLKWDGNNYETWEDACQNILDGHKINYGEKIYDYLPEVNEMMGNRVVLASQRNLQFRHEQIMKHNARMYNCTSTHLMRNRAFQEIFYLALCGCGVGVGLLVPFVNNLSRIKKRSLGTKTYVVPDSIEGWADSLGVLLSSYFVDKQPFPEYAGYEIKFDYSQIREKGSYISGGFRAPGHESLKSALEKIEILLEKWIDKEGDKIRPILAFDIVCHSADAVLGGGVRRAATNMIIDPNDEEMKLAKTGNWMETNPQRSRSNNSVLLLRNLTTKEDFEKIVRVNDGSNDLGFAFANSWFDLFNPCFEILKLPILYTGDLSKITYDEVEEFTREHSDLFGVQGCNLNEINGEKCTSEKTFLKACRAASILGSLQAGYTHMPYLGRVSEEIFKKEALLGVSITGWMNNPMLFSPELLRKGVDIVRETNKEIAAIIGINQAARLTAVKPSGNSAVILGTSSGIHPEHSEQYFRVMQLNKESDTAKYLAEHMSFLLENSVWSATNSDYVVFVPVKNPKDGLYKKDVKGVKHLELIKLVQEHWVTYGTNRELCVYPNVNHNVSCTVIIDNIDEIINYVWENKEMFTAISFLSDYGDKSFNQAPFTSVMTLDQIISTYGAGSLFASGLIVDGLHYFDDNLWAACDAVVNKDSVITGTREQVLLKKYWITRAKKFAKNYFKNDLQKMVFCLKDVHLLHKWDVINREFKEVDFSKILNKPAYKEISHFASVACSGGACEITRL